MLPFTKMVSRFVKLVSGSCNKLQNLGKTKTVFGLVLADWVCPLFILHCNEVVILLFFFVCVCVCITDVCCNTACWLKDVLKRAVVAAKCDITSVIVCLLSVYYLSLVPVRVRLKRIWRPVVIVSIWQKFSWFKKISFRTAGMYPQCSNRLSVIIM